jgi:hypothetical protein
VFSSADISATAHLTERVFGSMHSQQVEQLLREGVAVAGSGGTLGAAGENLNGVLHTSLFQDLVTGFTSHVVAKPPYAQAAQDALGWGLARRLGVDELVPGALVHEDGTALEELVAGATARSQGIGSYAALEDVATAARLHADPTLAPDAARSAARTNLELLSAIDYLIGNSDRTGNNVLADAATGVRYIDFGFAGASGGNQLRPALLPTFLREDAPGQMRLGADAMSRLREGLSHLDLTELHAQLQHDIALQPAIGGTFKQHSTDAMLRKVVSSPRFLGDMHARLDELLHTSAISYRPLTPAAERGVWLRMNALTHPGVAYAVGAGAVGGAAIGIGELARG